MSRPADEWTYSYASLAKLTGLSEEVLRQHRTRRKFNPADLETVLVWAARHARPDLRTKLIEYATGIALRNPAMKKQQ